MSSPSIDKWTSIFQSAYYTDYVYHVSLNNTAKSIMRLQYMVTLPMWVQTTRQSPSLDCKIWYKYLCLYTINYKIFLLVSVFLLMHISYKTVWMRNYFHFYLWKLLVNSKTNHLRKFTLSVGYSLYNTIICKIKLAVLSTAPTALLFTWLRILLDTIKAPQVVVLNEE